MTATALVLDPIHDDPPPVLRPQPRLRVIDGGSTSPQPARRSAASVEVYRRRRFFALVIVTALVLGIAWAAGISVTSFPPETTTDAAGVAQPVVHVVVPGDTYGSIAADLGAADRIAAADVLRAANGGADLVVGQRLVVDSSELAALRR